MALLFGSSGTARAVQVSPVIIDLEPVGSKSQSQLTVTNDGAEEVAVELAAISRAPGPDGKIVDTPADDRFLIFPLQARIPSGKRQVFRLQWLGDAIDKSESFAVSVRQVPVQLSQNFTGVQFLFNFNVVVWVTPPDAEADVQVLEAKPGTTPDGKPALTIVAENRGTRYSRFGADGIVVRTLDASGAAAQSVEVSGEKMRELAADLILLPGQRREIMVPMDSPVGGGGRIQVELP